MPWDFFILFVYFFEIFEYIHFCLYQIQGFFCHYFLTFFCLFSLSSHFKLQLISSPWCCLICHFFFNLYSQSFDWDVSWCFFNFTDSFFWQPWLTVNKLTHLIVFFSVSEFYFKYNFPFSQILYLFIITVFCLKFFYRYLK